MKKVIEICKQYIEKQPEKKRAFECIYSQYLLNIVTENDALYMAETMYKSETMQEYCDIIAAHEWDKNSIKPYYAMKNKGGF